MNSKSDRFDLIILGSGAAAFTAALKAIELEAKVAMVEEGTIGGTCINVGCMPSKYLLGIGNHHYYRNHGHPGLDIDSHADFPQIIRGKDAIVAQLREARSRQLEERNITPIKGHAEFLSPHELIVSGRRYYGDKFVIATGSSPQIIPLQGLESVPYLTSTDAMQLEWLPGSLIVIGGRAIGLEFAQMFAHFGATVTVLQRSERIVPDEEKELSDELKSCLEREGLSIRTGVVPKAVSRKEGMIAVEARQNGAMMTCQAEALLLATGRRPNTSGLWLDRAGVQVGDRGEIIVNAEMQTTASHIWAAGDVLGEPMLETVAAKEGAIAGVNALSSKKRTMDFHAVPHAVFTTPQLASVGLTEQKAREQRRSCRFSTISMTQVPRSKIGDDDRGLIKMVIDADTEEILGVHILASQAAEMIQEGVLAVRLRLTITDITDTVHVYPTMTEAVKMVAQSFRRGMEGTCCTE